MDRRRFLELGTTALAITAGLTLTGCTPKNLGRIINATAGNATIPLLKKNSIVIQDKIFYLKDLSNSQAYIEKTLGIKNGEYKEIGFIPEEHFFQNGIENGTPEIDGRAIYVLVKENNIEGVISDIVSKIPPLKERVKNKFYVSIDKNGNIQIPNFKIGKESYFAPPIQELNKEDKSTLDYLRKEKLKGINLQGTDLRKYENLEKIQGLQGKITSLTSSFEEEFYCLTKLPIWILNETKDIDISRIESKIAIHSPEIYRPTLLLDPVKYKIK